MPGHDSATIFLPGAGTSLLVDVLLERGSRLVLHFLLDEAAIEGYFRNLRTILRPDGHVLLAEFGLAGAPKCAGLEVHRYSSEAMAKRLGPEFELLRTEDFTFVNPAGATRPYVYALFRRA